MRPWKVVGLWRETPAVALACDALRQFGAAVQPLPPSWARRAQTTALSEDAVPPSDPTAHDDLGFAAGADVLVVDRPWNAALATARLPGGQIRCVITPWAGPWPWADAAGVDLLVQAAAGIAATNGHRDDPPLRAGVPLADVGTALAAAVGVVAALLERGDGGDRAAAAPTVEVVAEHVLTSYLGTLLPRYFLTGREPERTGNRHAMTAPWNSYPTRDGWIVITTMGDPLWGRLATLMGRSELIDDPRFATAGNRVDNVAELDAEISRWTRTLTSAEAMDALSRAGVPGSRIPSLAQVFGSASVRDRGLAGRPAGTLPALARRQPSPGGRRRRDATAIATGGRPLAGLRVLELGAFTAAPLATRILGHLGADVLKVEPPGGENCRHLAQQVAGSSYLYHLNNTDKRACVLDLTVPADHARMLALAADADVYVTNLALPTLEKLAVAPSDLLEVNPGLVACAITGFGLDSDRAHERAFDSVAQAATGLLTLTGFPDGGPVKTAVSTADLLAAWTAVLGVLAALDDEPRGGVVDVALQDAALWAVYTAWLEWRSTGAAPGEVTRTGNRHPLMHPHGCYATTDGHVAVAVRDDGEWHRLAGAVPECRPLSASTLADRRSHADEIDAALAAWTAARSTADAVDELCAHGVPAVPVRGLAHVTAAARASGLLVEQRLPGGEELLALRVPLRRARSEWSAPAVAPALATSDPEWLPLPDSSWSTDRSPDAVR